MRKYLKLSLFVGSVLLASLLISCGDRDKERDRRRDRKERVDFGVAPSPLIIESGAVDVVTEDKIRYHSINFSTSPYTVTMVETAEKLVIVDLSLDAVHGKELRKYANAIGKPISVIITHNHLDHFGGSGSFTDVSFYAENTVATLLNSADDFTKLYTKEVQGITESETIGGLSFTFDKVSNAETGENGYLYNETYKVLFVGDLVYNLTHLYLVEYTPKDGTDEIDNWVAGLEKLKTNFADYSLIFLGHNGYRSDIEVVIDENINYLRDAQALIKGTKELSGGGKATTNQQVVDELGALYPTYKNGGRLFALPDYFFPGYQGANWF